MEKKNHRFMFVVSLVVLIVVGWQFIAALLQLPLLNQIGFDGDRDATIHVILGITAFTLTLVFLGTQIMGLICVIFIKNEQAHPRARHNYAQLLSISAISAVLLSAALGIITIATVFLGFAPIVGFAEISFLNSVNVTIAVYFAAAGISIPMWLKSHAQLAAIKEQQPQPPQQDLPPPPAEQEE